MSENEADEPRRAGDSAGVWNDPRKDPAPPAPARDPADDPSEVEPLVRLCKRGHIYAVESWIAAGKPVQAKKYYVPGRRQIDSPLAVALQTGQQDLALLLLVNGYRVDLEPWSPLTTAISRRAWDVVELLLRWGASPVGADPDTVLNSYDVETIERFWRLGLDYTANDCLAWYLSRSTRNRPAYGWARRHHSEPRVARALALALVQAIFEKREKAAHLLVWAGADAHTKVPILQWKDDSAPDEEQDCSSAVELAVEFGVGKLLRTLRPMPGVDDFDKLFASACDPDAVDQLTAIRQPTDWSPTILRNVYRITNDVFSDSADENRWCLEGVARHGGRLASIGGKDVPNLRRDILRMSHPERQRWLLSWLSNPRNCDPGIYADLVQTAAMQAKLGELRLPKTQRWKADEKGRFYRKA